MKTSHTRLLVAAVLCLLCAGAVIGQPAVQTTVRVYRGSVGGSHIQMRLNQQGNKVSGTYFYDSIGEELKLSGQFDDQGRLELKEFGPKDKQTGKFTCKRKLDDPIDPDCSWSKPDGTREAYVTLEEQNIGFTSGLQIVPKTIINRRTGVSVSYPQVTSGDKPLPAAESFNRRILALVQKAIKEFEPGSEPGRNAFETNYNVSLANNSLISVEMREYSDSGGAHPNTGFWCLTYDLSENKEVKLEDLFKPDSDYKTEIAKYVVADIDRRAAVLEEADARREGRKPNPRDEPLMTIEQLSEISDFAITPRGLMIYFDFPHAIAVFDRTFIPYNAVSQHFKPAGPVARFLGSPKAE